MAYERKDGDIAVYRKDSVNPKAPSWTGELLWKGEILQVALWPKGDKGTMLAGRVQPKGQRAEPAPQANPEPKEGGSIAPDDIPFSPFDGW